MKKTLLALAVLGAFAGAAHAQSSVSITGNIDMGYQSFSPDADGGDVAGIENDGSSTSSIYFSGTEDLGGGLKAGFIYGTNIDMGAKDLDFGDAQNYLSLSGSFGTVKVGNINSQVMGASSTSQPFGTAIGSAYSGGFSRIIGVGVSDTVSVGAVNRVIRTGNSLYYTTPNFSGFEVTAGIAFENDEGATTNGMQEVALTYKANALNVALAHYETTAGDVATSGIAVDGDVSQTVLGANYTFGPATVYAGYSQSDSSDGALTAGDIDGTSYNLAAKYKLTPAVALMANFVRTSDEVGAAEIDRELFGLGADYSLSKRTTAYFRYESGDNNKDVDDSGFDRYALGLRHAF